MPTPAADAVGAGVARDGDGPGSSPGQTLRFTGALLRTRVPALWKRLPPLDGIRALDLTGVSALDSAGLALLAEIAGRTHAVEVHGDPPGLAELRSAYRLDATLGFGDT